MVKKFLKCGLIGWCLEIVWTGICSLISGNLCLTATTSLWMFPIYGLAAFISPIHKHIKNAHFIIRGGIYTLSFFFVEYATGMLLKAIGACPWDYREVPHNIAGVIRPDYAILWFISGLIFERILMPSGSEPKKK